MSPNPQNPDPVPAPEPESVPEAVTSASSGSESVNSGVFNVAAIASQVVSAAHEALIAAARFPQVPQELSVEFLHGVEPSALSTEECDAFHAAKAEVLAAQALDRHPGLQEDIESGALTTDQVAIAAAAIDRDKRRNPNVLTAEEEAELLA